MVAREGGAAKRDAAISQLRRGVIEFCVLALLADEERYGFELVQRLAGEDALVTTEGTLYPLLHGLEKKGYLRSTERRSGKSLRKVYRSTPQGRSALAAAKGKVRELFRELIEGR